MKVVKGLEFLRDNRSTLEGSYIIRVGYGEVDKKNDRWIGIRIKDECSLSEFITKIQDFLTICKYKFELNIPPTAFNYGDYDLDKNMLEAKKFIDDFLDLKEGDLNMDDSR